MSTPDRTRKLVDVLARARGAALSLREETEGVNAVILRAESMLAQLGLGVTASVKLWDDNDGRLVNVGFSKVDKHWRLTLETGWEGDEEVDVSPLANASREFRLAAIETFPELVEELIKQTEREVFDVAKKKAAADQYLDELGAALMMSTPTPETVLSSVKQAPKKNGGVG